MILGNANGNNAQIILRNNDNKITAHEKRVFRLFYTNCAFLIVKKSYILTIYIFKFNKRYSCGN